MLKPDHELSIIQLHSYDYGGGAEAVARINHYALANLGHRTQLIVGHKVGNEVDIDEIVYRRGVAGSRKVARKIEQVSGLQYIYSPSFRKIHQQFKFEPDIVHLHAMHGAGGWSDLAGVRKLKQRFATIYSLHDLWWLTGHCAYGMECEKWKNGCGSCPDLLRYPAIPRDGTKRNWARKKRLFGAGADHFIAPSDWVKRQAQQSPILQDCTIHVVPNPIDTAVFKPGNSKESRQLIGIPNDCPTVLIAANNLDSPFKGSEYAIDVLNRLVDTDTFAIVVGNSSQALLDRISLKGKSMGYIADTELMAHCYRAADVFLIPSRVETFGLVSAEAVACGAAVVSFEAGGLEEVTRAGHGIVVSDYDVDELHMATRYLLTNTQERLNRVTIGQRTVVRKYSPASHASGCISAYLRATESFNQRSNSRG